jgi:hypothetical protein
MFLVCHGVLSIRRKIRLSPITRMTFFPEIMCYFHRGVQNDFTQIQFPFDNFIESNSLPVLSALAGIAKAISAMALISSMLPSSRRMVLSMEILEIWRSQVSVFQ